MSEVKASRNLDDVLITYSLGSCIGVAVYDRQARVGGLLHYQLPAASLNLQRAAERPAMFADTGMDALFAGVTALGAQKRRLKVWIAGAAQILDDTGLFDIGRRNHAAIRKILWQNGMFIESEHVGGRLPRTMCLRIEDGTVSIRSNSKE